MSRDITRSSYPSADSRPPWRRHAPPAASSATSWRTFEARRPASPPARAVAPSGVGRRESAGALPSESLVANQLGPAPPVVDARHARVAAKGVFATRVVTSPNQDWVPEHPVERTVIRTYGNGLWGYQEYSRWPQPLTDNMWHVACIPQPGSVDFLPDAAWMSIVPEEDWEADERCSVKGVGYLRPSIRACLAKCAAQAIRMFDNTVGGPEHYRAYGQELRMVLRQCVDTMDRMPASRAVSVALGAHIQRVSLELVGLRIYLREVLPRILSRADCSLRVLPILGAFVHDGEKALQLARAGVPTWYIQPLTRDLKVWKVVVAERPRFLCREESEAHLEYDPQQLGGVLNTKGPWLSKMVFTISRQLCTATLTPLTEASGLVSKSLVMPAAPASAISEPSTKPKRTRRGRKKKKAEELQNGGATGAMEGSVVNTDPGAPEAVQGGMATPLYAGDLPPTGQPSREFMPSPFYRIPVAWARALQDAGSLPRTLQSATYFYPPPFLLDTVTSADDVPVPPITDAVARHDTKVHRYIHNLVRLRHFCRLRLLDPTISGRPMTIAEWRSALWGDYKVHAPSVTEDTTPQRRQEKRYKLKADVARLCAQSAALRSYVPDEVHLLDDLAVSSEVAARDIRVRLSLLWEAHEINFRCELVALDALMVPRADWPIVHRWARESQLSGVWGAPSSLVTVLPDTFAEMRSPWWIEVDGDNEDARSRGERSVRAFLDVMSRWADFPGDLLALSAKTPWTPDDYRRAQEDSVRFYTRSFVAQYHRLPVPPMFYPHHIPGLDSRTTSENQLKAQAEGRYVRVTTELARLPEDGHNVD